MNISQVGDAIHRDLFSVSGSDIPRDATLEFNTSIGPIPVPPQFVRPHLVVVESLTNSLPLGSATLRLKSPSTSSVSNDVAVTVSAGPPQKERLLHAGEAKARPYTIAFVANPLLPLGADPILSERSIYQHAVVHYLNGLFNGEEDLLRCGGVDARMRLVSVFPDAGTTLLPLIVKLNESWKIRDVRLAPFLEKFRIGGEPIQADVVTIIHGSTEPLPPEAWPTTDDPNLEGVPFTFDDTSNIFTGRHGLFPRHPGSFVVDMNVEARLPTAMHEFCHAASEVNNGWVTDLYNGLSRPAPTLDKLLINIRYRDNLGDPVPEVFARYNGTTFRSNPVRVEGTPYLPNWRAFHPEPIAGTRHNLMDDFVNEAPQPLLCRLDHLTHTWLRDRLNVKLSR